MIPSSPKLARSLASFGKVAGSIDVELFNCSEILNASSILSIRMLKKGWIIFSLKDSTWNFGMCDWLLKQAPADYIATKNSCNLPNNFLLVLLDAKTYVVSFEQD